jgi:hypothetical protein
MPDVDSFLVLQKVLKSAAKVKNEAVVITFEVNSQS